VQKPLAPHAAVEQGSSWSQSSTVEQGVLLSPASTEMTLVSDDVFPSDALDCPSSGPASPQPTKSTNTTPHQQSEKRPEVKEFIVFLNKYPVFISNILQRRRDNKCLEKWVN
jgi:hypothetical protein